MEVPPPPYPRPGRPQAGHPALHPWFPVFVCLTPWKTLRHGHTPLHPKSPPCIYLLLRVTSGGHPVMPNVPSMSLPSDMSDSRHGHPYFPQNCSPACVSPPPQATPVLAMLITPRSVTSISVLQPQSAFQSLNGSRCACFLKLL